MDVFDTIDHTRFMREALREAEKALKRGDRPIGAVVVHWDRVIARGANVRSVVYGMPDNHIRARDMIPGVAYVRRRIHNYVGGVLEDDCVALYRWFSPEEAELMLQGRPGRS